MKPKHLILGLFLLFLGSLFFLDNLRSLNFNWDIISRLWPLLLILLGIAALNIRPDVKSIFFALTAILLALLVFSSVKHGQFSIKEFFKPGYNLPSHII
ncbi:MAG: DUF5668 domain-containing protein [Candidatus Omnitrophota bacterium]